MVDKGWMNRATASGSMSLCSKKSQTIGLMCLAALCLSFLFFQDVYASIGARVCNPPITEASEAIARGRHDEEFPSPRCCVDEECLKNDNGNYAVLTTLRTDTYLPLVQHLACSLKNSNPNQKLLVATVKGDLSDAVISTLSSISNIKIYYWDEFRVENKLRERFALNWVKLRAWQMTEYDAILMLDGDTLVEKNLDSLWKLPAHFAAAHDQDKSVDRYNSLGRMQGGVVLLRPCQKVAEHMMHLVKTNETLQFSATHAEQSFFDWYFRYDRWMLPSKYNAIAPLLQNKGEKTYAGTAPAIVHYARAKPFSLTPNENHEQIIATGC
jgi:hypothetical protein